MTNIPGEILRWLTPRWIFNRNAKLFLSPVPCTVYKIKKVKICFNTLSLLHNSSFIIQYFLYGKANKRGLEHQNKTSTINTWKCYNLDNNFKTN